MALMDARVEIEHPLREIVRSTQATEAFLAYHPTDRGFVTAGLLRAGSRVQQRYEILWDIQNEGECADPRELHRNQEEVVYRRGPCTCEGTSPPCQDLVSAVSDLRSRAPRETQSVVFRIEGDRCWGRYRSPPGDPEEGGERTRRPGVQTVDEMPLSEAKRHLGLPALTSVERETLRAALRHRYFDDPRGCTLEELADALGISKSGAWYRLQSLQKKSMELMGRLEWIHPGIAGKSRLASPANRPRPAGRER